MTTTLSKNLAPIPDVIRHAGTYLLFCFQTLLHGSALRDTETLPTWNDIIRIQNLQLDPGPNVFVAYLHSLMQRITKHTCAHAFPNGCDSEVLVPGFATGFSVGGRKQTKQIRSGEAAQKPLMRENRASGVSSLFVGLRNS